MSHLPWFPFYVEKWRLSRKVRAMPRHIRSMYIDILCDIWEQGPIPDDEEAARSLLGETKKSFAGAWKLIRDALNEVEGGRLTSEFLEEQRVNALDKSDKQSKRAKSRWEKHRAGVPRHMPDEDPRQSGGSAIVDPRSEIFEKEKEHPPVSVPDPLVGFWGAVTGELMPNAYEFSEVRTKLRAYAAAAKKPFPAVVDLALAAFRDEVESWSTPRSLTASLFNRKWSDIQARMSGALPTSKAPPRAANGPTQGQTTPGHQRTSRDARKEWEEAQARSVASLEAEEAARAARGES